MAGASVDVGGMRQSAAHMTQARVDVRGHLKKLQIEIAHLRTTWDGRAASIFDNTMVDWHGKVDVMAAQLDEMAKILIDEANRYQRTEDSNQHVAQF